MKNNIPIFLASDEKYLPYLSVTVESIKRFKQSENEYSLYVLCDSLSPEAEEALLNMSDEDVRVYAVSVRERTEKIKESLALRLRDYYSEAIFYRLFIPSLFPDLKKAVYIDCDVVLNTDIAELYYTDIGDCLLGGVVDESVTDTPEFAEYTRSYLGIEPERYINSGVLIMNLDMMRREAIEEKFLDILTELNPDTVAPDQDYLNLLSKDRIYYLPTAWNKQPGKGHPMPSEEIKLVHYNMFNKPWKYSGVMYEEMFWQAAKTSSYFGFLIRSLADYSAEERGKDVRGAIMLLHRAKMLGKASTPFVKTVKTES